MATYVPAHPKFVTLERHILEGERQHPRATGEFSDLLHSLSLAAKLARGPAGDAHPVDGPRAR